MKIKPLIIAMGLVTIPITGCNDDSSSVSVTPDTPSPLSPSTTYSVRAVDGYLRGATVWLDSIEQNFKLDEGEPSVKSVKGGLAILDVSNTPNPEQYPVVVQAIAGTTIDEDTITEKNTDGVPLTADFVLSAPAGQVTVTPLSTLVHIKMESTQGLSEAEAVSAVSTDLGIPEEDILGDYIEKDKGDTAAKANALVELEVLPETPEELKTLSENDQALTNDLAPHTKDIKTLTEDTRIIKGVDGEAVVVENKDGDNDGIIDAKDAFPDDSKEWLDTDGDTIGNNADTDDDNDDYLDVDDAFPLDKTEWLDTDGDKTGNNADTDDDNDGYLDAGDAFPLDKTEWLDTDDDKIGNNADTDDDNDDYLDVDDAFPLDKTEWLDTDGDKTGNNADTDDDNDGVADAEDKFPLDNSESSDRDGDNVGDNADAYPDDPTKSVADSVTTDSYTSPFIDELANGVVIVDVDVKTTVANLINGDLQTTTETTYSTESGVAYGTFTEVELLATDGNFSRISSYRYDYNQDGTTKFEGKLLDVGNRTSTGETYWRYIDETDGSAEGVNNGGGRTFDDLDFSARVLPTDLTGIDTIQEHTTNWSTSNGIVTANISYDQYDVSGFVLADTSTHVTNYASSSERKKENGRLISLTIERDWAGNGTVNERDSFTALADAAYTVTKNGPVWANPQDGMTEEYADYNFTPDNWDSLTQYWYEYSLSVDAQGEISDSGKRYILDQAKDANEVEANIKLVTAENPSGLLFHEWSSTRRDVSDSESNEAVNWTHYPLDGYDFTAATLDTGQAYRVNLKQSNGLWISYSFDEWGSQAINDLASQIDNARSGGTNVADIDNSVIAGLSRYAAVLPNGSFQYDDAGNAVQWYAVTKDERLTDGNPAIVPMTLTDNGIKQDWYIFSSSVDLIVAAPIDEQNTWPWFNAYYRQFLNTYAMDLTSDSFSWTTDIGQLFLDQTAAQARLDEINATPAYAVCESENTGEVANSTDTYTDFVPAAGNCGYTSIDSAMLDGVTLYNKESDTSYNSYQFNSDGNGTYTESDGDNAGFTWSVNNDSIIAINNGGDNEYFALIATEGNKYSVLGFYIWDDKDVHYTEIIGQEFTTDEPVLPNNTADIIQFLKDSGTVYSLWKNDFNQLFVETITVSEDRASMTAVGRVQPDRSLTTLPLNYDMDVELTSSGWAVPEGYTIDMAGGELKAYPGTDSTYSYTLSGSIVDLEGKVIATSTPDWEKFDDTNATFAPGSKLAELKLIADTKMYYLWDSNAWVMRNDAGHDTDGANATSLDDLVSHTSVGDTAPADTMIATSVAYEISVEFVEGGVANFYTFDWTTDTATKIGQGAWERDDGLPAEIIAYSITAEMINQFNATSPGVWPGEAEEQHRILSVYEGTVRNGEFEPAGTVDDDGFTLYTQTAKNDVLSQATISCSFDHSAQAWDRDRFLEQVNAYQQCSGITLPTVTAESMKDTVTHKVNSEGEDRTYYYHADGTLTYDKNGALSTRTWTVDTIDGFTVIQQKSADGSVNLDQMVLLSQNGDELTYAYYWTDTQESETRVMTDISYRSSINACYTGDSAWDDVKEQPAPPYSTSTEYDAAVANCTSSPLPFTSDILTNGGSSATWIIGEIKTINGTRAFMEDENIRFDNGGYGAFIDDEDGDFPFNWTLNNDGVLSLDITHPKYDANKDMWTLLQHDDANDSLSVKSFWQDLTEWDPIPAAEEGEILGLVMTLSD
ncbi:hypothetical protein [Photobacterium lipolyticum]|uniref:Uncharacterized protein n=1 Tax=Photobacterium lipolyticum TaxID=266810 RepID=A0A2T3N396_9GAMM|nr:hypothetical protein [Photobacterium lipolyticum]PSW06842.1 hypothetical protein C9I89_04825 [Photobacterium lipolyticum]